MCHIYVKDSCQYNLRWLQDVMYKKGTFQNNLFYKGIRDFIDLSDILNKNCEIKDFKN